jgi:hypothetical protein
MRGPGFSQIENIQAVCAEYYSMLIRLAHTGAKYAEWFNSLHLRTRL